ncbi:uncharacterized protein [Pyrus communis]|uniref:uncharacterized protein n=1 Tax=Pyrus communis TaxID=23211 RepID=UPI0035BFE7F1
MWYGCSLQLDIVALKGRDFREYWGRLCDRFRDNERQDELLLESVFLMWRIWKCRYDMIFKRVPANPIEVINIARQQVVEFHACHDMNKVVTGGVASGGNTSFAGQQVRWKRPIFEVLKINCDGSWCGKTCKDGYGWACLELGCTEVEVELDSQLIIRMVNEEYVIDATLECFLHDIRFLASQLGTVTFAFVERHGNTAAHVVASYVTSRGGAFRWDAIDPEFLFNILAEDVNITIRI